MSLATTKKAQQKFEGRYQREKGQRDMLQQQLKENESALGDAQRQLETWEEVQLLLQHTAEAAREQLTTRIEEVVTNALCAVFEAEMQFRVTLRRLNNRPAAEFSIASDYGDGEVETSVEDARGGGVVDVVSLALRLAVLELHRPKIHGPLILDESCKHVSKEFVPNVAEFLKQYSERTGRQILFVTHISYLADMADKGFSVRITDGESAVSDIG